METKHTPTPWFLFQGGRAIGQSDGRGIAALWGDEEEQQANAAFIVRACNTHDESVATLREVLDYLHNCHPITAAVRDRIVAAIAAAEGSAQ